MIHHHHAPLHARNQIHGAAHALDQLSWNHPVSKVASLAHFHGAQNGKINVATANHGETVGAGKETMTSNTGHGLFARVD